jgi:aminoglycoside phosphotransferase (APT) family kinase protein
VDQPADPPGLDLARLRVHLDTAAPGLVRGPLSAQVIAGGRSNLSYVLTDGEHRWVLRRPPLGHVLATAHDMGREHRVMTALAPTPVPVPATVLLCADPDVLGAPFYIMEFVDGAIYRSPADTRGLDADRCDAIAGALIDTLAELHELDPAEIGLADFGRPAGFLERQVRRWKTQLDASNSRPLPGADELHAALAAAVPESARPCLLHGDYRLDNVVVGSGDRIAAVLDWEMSALGDPLADLGLFLVYYSGVEAIPGVVAAAATGETAFPAPERLVERYARRRPVDLSRLDWYVAFGFFKLAVIAEGIYYRFVAGQTVGAGFDRMGDAVLPLITAGTQALARDEASRRGTTGTTVTAPGAPPARPR